MVEEIQPESLPFEFRLLQRDILWFLHPPPGYNDEPLERLFTEGDDSKEEGTKKDQTDVGDIPPGDKGVLPPEKQVPSPGNAGTNTDGDPLVPSTGDANRNTDQTATCASTGLEGSKDLTSKEVEGASHTPEDLPKNNATIPPGDGLQKDADAKLQLPTEDSTQIPPLHD